MAIKKILTVLLPILCSLLLTIIARKYTSKNRSKQLDTSKLEIEEHNVRKGADYGARRKIASRGLSFYVMGDIPYSEREYSQLKDQMRDLSSSGSFIVHVGDMQRPQNTDCEYEAYKRVRDILYDNSDIPVMLLPGDNDYLDCERPRHARAVWLKHFSSFEKNWAPLPFRVEKKEDVFYDYWDDDAGDDDLGVSEDFFDDEDFEDDDYGVQFWKNARNWQVDFDSEYFTFVYKEVIFIGINLQGGSGQSGIFSQMIDWTERSLLKHEDDYDAIVIFGHAGADHVRDGYFDKFKRFHDDSDFREIPMLYIHGNGHEYDFYKPFGRDNMAALQVDQGKNAPPLKVTVDFDRDYPFRFDRRK